MTHYDDHPVLAVEAELIHAAARFGIPLPLADHYELWEMASAMGLHRVESRDDHDNREIVDKKADYWEETYTKRAEILQRRKERKVT